MKIFLKTLVFSFVLGASAQFAHATTLSGSISFTGTDTLVMTKGVVTEIDFGNSKTTGSTFTNFNVGHGVTMADPTGNFTFSGITAPGGENLFATMDTPVAGVYQALGFNATSYTALAGGQYLFLGSLTLYNCPNGAATCNTDHTVASTSGATALFSTTGPGTFSLVAATTPEPSSLVLLGTGLMGAAGFMFRKRRINA